MSQKKKKEKTPFDEIAILAFENPIQKYTAIRFFIFATGHKNEWNAMQREKKVK